MSKPLVAIGAGGLLGVTAAAADKAGGPGTSDLMRAILWIPNAGSIWVALAFLTGSQFRRRAHAALWGCASLVVAACAYYIFGLTLGDRADAGLMAVLPTWLLWLAIGVAAGPLIGMLGSSFRHGRRSVGGFVASLAVPFAVIVESGGYLLRENLGWRGSDPWKDGLLYVMLLFGLVLAALLVRRWRRRPA